MAHGKSSGRISCKMMAWSGLYTVYTEQKYVDIYGKMCYNYENE